MFDRSSRRRSSDGGKRRKGGALRAEPHLHIGDPGPGPGSHDVHQAAAALQKQGSLAARPSTAPFSTGAARSLGGPSVTALSLAHARESVQSARAASRTPAAAQYLAHSDALSMSRGRGAPPFGTAPRFASTATELAAALEPGPGAFSPVPHTAELTAGWSRPTFSRAGRLNASEAPGDSSTGPAALALLLSAKRRTVPSIPAPHEAGFEEGQGGSLRAVFVIGGREVAAPDSLNLASAELASAARGHRLRQLEAAAASAESQLVAFAAAAASVPGPGSYDLSPLMTFTRSPGAGAGASVGTRAGATSAPGGGRPGTGTGLGVSTAARITIFDVSASPGQTIGPGPGDYSPILPQEVPGPSARLASAAFASTTRRGIEAIIGRPGTSSNVGPGSFDVAAASAALTRGRRRPAASATSQRVHGGFAGQPQAASPTPPPFMSTAPRLAPVMTDAAANAALQRARVSRPHSAPSTPAPAAHRALTGGRDTGPGAASVTAAGASSAVWPAVGPGSYDVRLSSTDAIASRARDQAARLALLAPAREAHARAKAARRARSAGVGSRAALEPVMPVPAFDTSAPRFPTSAVATVGVSESGADQVVTGPQVIGPASSNSTAFEFSGASHGMNQNGAALRVRTKNDTRAARDGDGDVSPSRNAAENARKLRVKHASHSAVAASAFGLSGLSGPWSLPHVGPGTYAVDPVLGPAALVAASRPSAAFASSVSRTVGSHAGSSGSRPGKALLPALMGDSISRVASSIASHGHSLYHDRFPGDRDRRKSHTSTSGTGGHLLKGRASLGMAQPPAPFSGKHAGSSGADPYANPYSHAFATASASGSADYYDGVLNMHQHQHEHDTADPLAGGASIVNYAVSPDGARLPRGSSLSYHAGLHHDVTVDDAARRHGALSNDPSAVTRSGLLKHSFSASAQQGRFDAVTAAAAHRSSTAGLRGGVGDAASSGSPGPGAYDLRQALPALPTPPVSTVYASHGQGAGGVAPWTFVDSAAASASASASSTPGSIQADLPGSTSAAIYAPLSRLLSHDLAVPAPVATAAFGSAPRFPGTAHPAATSSSTASSVAGTVPPGPAAYRPEAATGFRSRRTFNVALAANEIRRALRS